MPVAPSSPLPRDPTGLLRWAPRDAFHRAVAEDLRARADDHDHRVHLYDARTPELEKINPPVMFVFAGTGPQAVWRGKYVEGTTTSVEGLAHVQGAWLPVRVTARDPGKLVLARIGARWLALTLTPDNGPRPQTRERHPYAVWLESYRAYRAIIAAIAGIPPIAEIPPIQIAPLAPRRGIDIETLRAEGRASMATWGGLGRT